MGSLGFDSPHILNLGTRKRKTHREKRRKWASPYHKEDLMGKYTEWAGDTRDQFCNRNVQKGMSSQNDPDLHAIDNTINVHKGSDIMYSFEKATGKFR